VDVTLIAVAKRAAGLALICSFVFHIRGVYADETLHPVKDTPGQLRYTNVRYAYAVSYPADIFNAEPESESGDGRRLVSKDSKATIFVYAEAALGGPNSDLLTFAQLYKDQLNEIGRESKITYKTAGQGWFVISGTKGNQIFYQKTLYDKGIEKVFRAEYDRSLKEKYDPVVARSAASFANVLGGWVGSKTMGSRSKYLKP
jgi:hypothetical protein